MYNAFLDLAADFYLFLFFQESRYSKMEKADILELTVHHLKSVHRHQNMMQSDSQNLNQKYTAGFSECANEVAQFLNSMDCLTPQLRVRIMSHLSESLQKSAHRASNIQTPTPILATPAFSAVSPAVTPITTLPCATSIAALPGSTEARYPASISPLSLITSTSSIPVALPSGVLLIQPGQISPSPSTASMSPSGFSASSPSHSSSSMASPVYSPSSVSSSSPASVSGAIPLYVTLITRYSPVQSFQEQISCGRSSTSPSLADDVPSSFDDAQMLRDTVITTNYGSNNIVSSCKSEARVGYSISSMVSSSNESMWRPW